VTHVMELLSPVAWAAGAAYGVGLWAILGTAMRRTGTRTLGPADRVTLARAILAGVVTTLVVDGGAGAALTAVASMALLLDAVDGQVARRTGTVSRFGARFDMEADAFLILVLSVHVSTTLGLWTLAIGAMRYAFVAASWALPWLRGDLPPSRARRAVAASQGILLVAAGVVPHPVAFAVVAAALAMLAWSFGRDIAWLRGTHAPAPAPAPMPKPKRVPVGASFQLSGHRTRSAAGTHAVPGG
jgi:phosphatidylglycerophosphate synthase